MSSLVNTQSSHLLRLNPTQSTRLTDIAHIDGSDCDCKPKILTPSNTKNLDRIELWDHRF
ncbi:hypothetical protein F511_10786 [Dorcoceras hygrometricum]|uniref:Uncharacterized protein n=1 Tax=Dorcoceras hygrometricum TaxID=472368 RepID=A0A2Z7CM70_9LAMI|nr:hypothetical protein F511_10786 [Dorcoceras hygrometricum]